MTTETLDQLIQRYGMPHEWDTYVRFINKWRLVIEAIETRLIIDVALHCPNERMRRVAASKFKGVEQALELDGSWPGRGDFAYNWEGVDWSAVDPQ